jgi:Arc/MetJ-type ribon-helix-helix transcriptional regulator
MKTFIKRLSILPAIPEEYMPKVTVEIPQHIIDDVNTHVGDGKKFVTFSDAVRTALRKMLDQLDEVDRRRGRIPE